jgi:hypothetical protein
MNLAATGVVLGIDVGYSETSKSTCFCTIAWDTDDARIDFRLTTANEGQRANAIDALTNGRRVAGVALDGPLTRGFRTVAYYRAAEALLSRGPLQKRGKPGQTSSPVGQKLHGEALRLADQVIRRVRIDRATHHESIDTRRVVEAFPNIYLAALVPESAFMPLARNASDAYWDLLATKSDRLMYHMRWLLPGRDIKIQCRAVLNHDYRAGLTCALTALVVTQGTHVAVGDMDGGDVMLPPVHEWGRSPIGRTSWLEPVLRTNLAKVIANKRAHSTHAYARIIEADKRW